MAWTVTGDLEVFLAAAGAFLRSRPDEHTVLLTVTGTLRHGAGVHEGALGESALFGWCTAPGGAVEGAFAHTPPRPVVLAAPRGDAAASLAGSWDQDRPLPGVVAEPLIAEAFAGAWRARTGTGISAGRRSRLHRLERLRPPEPMPAGRARPATAADRELLVGWYAAFAAETDDPGTRPHRQVEDRLGYGGLTLWEDGGTPVCLAGISRTVAGSARVTPVYTPPGLRGRGYAGAAVAAVSQAALNAGAEWVLLFTDLTNPTSNALYRRLGYVPVSDRITLDFGT